MGARGGPGLGTVLGRRRTHPLVWLMAVSEEECCFVHALPDLGPPHGRAGMLALQAARPASWTSPNSDHDFRVHTSPGHFAAQYVSGGAAGALRVGRPFGQPSDLSLPLPILACRHSIRRGPPPAVEASLWASFKLENPAICFQVQSRFPCLLCSNSSPVPLCIWAPPIPNLPDGGARVYSPTLLLNHATSDLTAVLRRTRQCLCPPLPLLHRMPCYHSEKMQPGLLPPRPLPPSSHRPQHCHG